MRIATVAVLCCTLIVGCPKQPTPERPRGPTDGALTQKKAAEKRYAAVVKTLRAAVKKGGKPNIETVLQRHFEKIDPVCHGKLATKAGLIAIPRRHKKLPRARLEPGLVLFLESDGSGGSPSTAPKRTESTHYSVCFLSIAPPEEKKPWRVTLQMAGNIMGPFDTLKQSWQEFPPGNAILTLDADNPPEVQKGDEEEQTETAVRVVFSYVAGRLFELHSGVARMAHTSTDLRSQEIQSLKFLSAGTPVRHLMVETSRSESAMKEPSPDGGKDWGEGTWEETYTIYQFNKRFDELKELKGQPLEAVLEYTSLAPYRTKKTGKGTSFD